MTNYEKYFAEQMKNEEFCKEYEDLEPELAVVQAIINARQTTGLTQKELSDPIKTLKRLATAMGKHLKIAFV